MVKKILLIIGFIIAPDLLAQERIALVIGNSEYSIASLKNPTNDATDIADTLKTLRFDVDLKLDANQEEMENSIRRFGKKLTPDTVGLFYYSGHAAQYNGSNYLIPIGSIAQLSSAEHLRYKTVDVGYVLGVMKQAGNALNIVILDSCRDNPFQAFSRSMSRGLKRIPSAEGTLVAYSTSPGHVALDGDKRNSPYTEQLIKFMKEPGLPIEIMFKKVRTNVKINTGGEQSPWYESSIDGDFYFSEKKSAPAFPKANTTTPINPPQYKLEHWR